METLEDSDRTSNPFVAISRMGRGAKRVTRHNLAHCRHYQKFIARWSRIQNAMAVGYRRVHRVGKNLLEDKRVAK